MALIARVSEESFFSREADFEEEAPTTSRSPSFVRIAAERVAASERDPAEFVTLAEPSAPASHDEEALLARWNDLEVVARARMLRVEETMARVRDEVAKGSASFAKLESLVHALLEDAHAVTDTLRALHVTWASEYARPALAATFPVVAHVFEWVSGVLVRADDCLVGALEGIALSSDELTAFEYSSLFVRTIIDPMLADAIRENDEARDRAAALELRKLRERAVWLNWTVRALEGDRIAASGAQGDRPLSDRPMARGAEGDRPPEQSNVQ
jgi:hypothetical protein